MLNLFRCSTCERLVNRLYKSNVEGGSSKSMPGHEKRMVIYTARAALGEPLHQGCLPTSEGVKA